MTSITDKNNDLEFALNSHPDTVYTNSKNPKESTEIKRLNLVIEEEEIFSEQISPKVLIKIFIQVHEQEGKEEEIQSFKIKKRRQKKGRRERDQELTLSTLTFEKLKTLLEALNNGEFKNLERKYKFTEESKFWIEILKGRIMESDELKKFLEIRTESPEKAETLKKVLTELNKSHNIVDEGDIFSIGEKKKALKEFKKQIEEKKWREKERQSFFEKNLRIFWYGLDYKFLNKAPREINISQNTRNSEWWWLEKPDFTWIYENWLTTLIEIKLPETKVFWEKKNRTNDRKLSQELIDSVSQICGYRARSPTQKTQTFIEGSQHFLWTLESNAMLIIWSRKEIEEDTDEDKVIKTETFNFFRNNLKNIIILTYDELLNRAKKIIEKIENQPPNNLHLHHPSPV